jgi:class 3 adenylate cyclase/tetratricopeptide (TPR) repeat protein
LPNIQSWLSDLGLDRYLSAFIEAEIDFETLPDLEEEDLKELGLPLGPRRKVWAAIKRFGEPSLTPAPDLAETTTLPLSSPKTEPATPTVAERRHLTVMFVDLVGSTEMATKIDAEDMRDVITRYQNTVASVVARHEGFIARYMGDGVLCYFGWPRASEDDAERALRAGLDIVASVKKMVGPQAAPLASRVGVATGVVIVGDLIGTGAAQEAAVVGETPNLAARLQGLAKPNQLVISEETRRLLGHLFDLQSLGAEHLKGIAKPVQSYAVVGQTMRESRFEALRSGTLSPIVGRDRELELMRECWAETRAGTGQMILVSGEAGIGKSRITQAVVDAIAEDQHTRITYQCSPYHADSAFYPLIQHLSFVAGFTSNDGPDARLDKLEVLLGVENDAMKLIAPMMGLDGAARYGALGLTPAQQRAQTMRVLTELLVQQAEDQPVLLVYEDLHWIDPTSLELLNLSLDAATDQQIMILATARPTFDHGFGGHPIVTRIALNRLATEQITAIVSKLTGGKALPDEIMAIIVQRTDGVPLFVEELTKTVLESGALKADGDLLQLEAPLSDIAIPTTLHDSLMARLDRLQPIKDVAQTASCIGREFSHGLLAEISPLPEAELDAALNGLIAAELIYRRGLPPDATYVFKHALVRDAAYQSLLKERRRAVHTRVLSALAADPNVSPEVLAVHAEAAGLTDRAIDLRETAGKAAIARPAFDEGMAHLTHAMNLLAPKVDTEERQALERSLELQTQLGYASMARHGWGNDKTKASLERALMLADRVGETPLRFSVLFGLMTTRYMRGEHAAAVQLGQLFVDMSESATETAPAVVANRAFAIALMLVGNFERAQQHYERALELFDPAQHGDLAHLYGMDLGVASHGLICTNLSIRGETRRAEQLFLECERYAVECKDVSSNCYMHQLGVYFHLVNRNFHEMERHTKSLSNLARQYDLSFYGVLAGIFQNLLNAGNGDQAGIAEIGRLDDSIVAANALGNLSTFRIEAGHRALALGLRDEAAQLATAAQDLIDQTDENLWLSELHRLHAGLATADGDVEAAERHLKNALEVAHQQGAKLPELRAAIDMAHLWQEPGRIDEAIALLEPVHNSIAEGDCPADRRIAGELLADLAQ